MPNVKKAYDVAVAYRIYPQVSGAASSLPFADDKYRLSEICLKSFKESLGDLQIKLWVLLDGCSPEYARLFERYFCKEDLVLMHLNGVGNQITFNNQITILLEQDDASFVYFAEDDYFYVPGQCPLMVDFLRANADVDFVSPYDHTDCYTQGIHRHPKWLRVFADHHWRTAASTCLTFLTRKNILEKTAPIFRRYKRRSDDCTLWLSLTKRSIFNPIAILRYGVQQSYLAKIIAKSWMYCWRQILFGRRYSLWIPLPGVATHLDSKALSPVIDWPTLMRACSDSLLQP